MRVPSKVITWCITHSRQKTPPVQLIHTSSSEENRIILLPSQWERSVLTLMPWTLTSLLTGQGNTLTFIYTHRNKQSEDNKKITVAHFPSKLKGKITRVPQQISWNEWFIIGVKHGGGGMRSLWPLLVGLINHVITEMSLDGCAHHSDTEHSFWSECFLFGFFTAPSRRFIFNNLFIPYCK